MCGITVITGKNAHIKLYGMLQTLQHRGPDGTGAWADGKVIYGDLSNIKIPSGSMAIGHNLLSIVGNQEKQPLQSHRIVLTCNGEIYNYPQLRYELEKEDNYNFKTDSDSEVVLALINRYYNGSLHRCIRNVLELLDGDYSFAAYDGKDLVAVRDPVGVKPLYYGKNNEYFGLASERKALWKVGITETNSLPPKYMIHNQELLPLPERFSWNASFLKKGLNGNSSNHCESSNPDGSSNNNANIVDKFINNPNKEDIKNILKDKLLESVKKRIRGLEKVGILFSGGVDSTLLTVICNDLDVEIELYAVGSEGSPDLNFAEKISTNMGLPIYIRMVDEELIREYTPIVLNAIEEWNLMKLGVGMTTYLAAEMAHKNGLRVMLSGQGADELFAGYHRYLGFYHEKGEEAQKDLMGDVENLYHVNLERDDKVTMASSVELRVPYLDLQIINMAMDIPMKYKINGKDDQLRKCVLREVASEIGVPREIVNRPKKAAQYGSGIHKILTKKVLKDHEYMEKLKNSFTFIDI